MFSTINIELTEYNHEVFISIYPTNRHPTMRNKPSIRLNYLSEITERLANAMYQYQDNKELSALAQEGYWAYSVFKNACKNSHILSRFIRANKSPKMSTPRIHVGYNNQAIPFELFYDEDPKKSLNSNHFWGMKYLIRKSYMNTEDLDELHENETTVSNINLAYARSTNLINTNKEIEFFNNSKHINFKDFSKDIQRHNNFQALWDASHNNNHIIHFSTHAFRENNRTYIEVENVTYPASDFLAVQLKQNYLPIMVLNCCWADKINNHAGSSLVETFYPNLSRGLVATNCDVKDAIASEYTKIFYEKWTPGISIGDALDEARRTFFNLHHGDVSTLAYSLYCLDPDYIIYQR